jgi:glycosyltransferase involved in cell wall biosynthesis
MKISVIIPTYNRKSFLLRAVKSVQAQSAHVSEIIVVDDGSTDGTKELIEHENIEYIYQENKGVSSARNCGIKKAKNEWIAFLDSDDEWEPDKVAHHISCHSEHPTLLASFSDELWIRNDKIVNLKPHQKKEEPSFLNSLRLCKIGTSTFFCSRKIFDKVGDFDEGLQVCEDYDLWLRILLEHDIKFINKKLVRKYAGHKNQLSFESPLIDMYRIDALEKHVSSKHKSEVIHELIYKTTILLKGAQKHHNKDVIEYCEKKLKYYLI